LLTVLALLAPGPAIQAQEMVEMDGFRLGYESHLQPLRINTMHGWTLTLETPAGEPIGDAEILVSGGMPEHDHGLSTAPRVTRQMEGGRYVVEGMKFHMSGRWEIVFQIQTAAEEGRVTVELMVPEG
jgi:hypothetical protein